MVDGIPIAELANQNHGISIGQGNGGTTTFSSDGHAHYIRVTGGGTGAPGRENGVDEKAVKAWLEELGWETLVNKRSTSWKALDPATRETMDNTSALSAIMSQPTLIKRPLLDIGHERHTGFSAAAYAKIFNKHTL